MPSSRVICPACRKQNRVADDTAGAAIVCLACGARIPATAPRVLETAAVAANVEADSAPEASAADDDGVADVTAIPAAGVARRVRFKQPSRAPLGRLVLVAAAGLLIGGVVGAVIMLTKGSSQQANVKDMLALKSEAEALAIAGNLEAAHAKYRELQAAGIGVQVKDSMNWDILDRAKSDQDRIMTLLLDKAQALNPPDRVIPKPGPGSATRADDPWYWPRVGNGGRAEIPPTDDADAEYAGEPDAPAQELAQASPASPVASPEIPTTAETITPRAEQSIAVEDKPDAPTTTAPSGAANLTAKAPTPPKWVSEQAVTDEQIGFALERGIDNLLGQIKDSQVAPMEGMTRTKFAGRNALIVYALLQAGRATKDKRLDPRGEFMGKLIDKMKEHEMERGGREPSQPVTYARSIRAAALAVYNRPQDREVLKADTEWLIKAAVNGAYTYDDEFSDMDSRRSYGLLQWDGVDDDWFDVPADDDLLAWGDAEAILCHGVHDGSGRELNRMRRPPLPKLKRTPPPDYTKRPRTNPPRMGGQPRTPTPGNPGGRTMPDPPRPQRLAQDRTPPPDSGSDTAMFPWDNSNSQYGLLGVWAAAEAGVEVPKKYWEAVQNHWQTWQFKTGEWGYIAPDRQGYLSMTCGGISSLWVTYDWLVAPKSKAQVGRDTMSPNLRAGMKWLETANNAVTTPIPGKTHYPGYDLFGLERVGLASGFKYFGTHDWYRELAAKTVASQFPNGAWGRDDGHPDGLIETAYQLLFLSHGRHPIFMNKLRFDRGVGEKLDGKPVPGYWANRPRDIANLTRYASRDFERPFNWQVVDLPREWHDWLDCPVLYIASHNPPLMGEAEFAKLRQFAEAGGILFTHADAGAPNFTRWVIEELVPKTFPGRKAEPLPEGHEIYSLHYDIPKPRPQLWGVSNGSRLLLVHSPSDLASAWQQRADRTHTPLFRLGVHMFLYAAGRADFRNRIDSPYVPPAPEGDEGTIAVARVKYDGAWDPEPGAWRRFANFYQWEMGINVPVTATDFGELDVKKASVAHLTGNTAVAFTDVQAAGLKAYVEAGGVVLIDACGGSRDFNLSVRDGLLAKAFPNAPPEKLPPRHPVLTADTPDGEPLPIRLRPYALDKLKLLTPSLEIVRAGKGSVILSRVDITTGLLGTNTLTIVGYDAPYAQAIVWNLLGWAAANAPGE